MLFLNFENEADLTHSASGQTIGFLKHEMEWSKTEENVTASEMKEGKKEKSLKEKKKKNRNGAYSHVSGNEFTENWCWQTTVNNASK